MSILNQLTNKQTWQEFLNYKIEKSNLRREEEQALTNFINNEEYLQIANQIQNEEYTFSIPTKKLINKSGSTKKRVVYSFTYAENMILKCISYLMSKYDSVFPDNLYSFRKNCTVKTAFYSIIKHKNIENMFAYKLDISNYFNTINIDKLLPILKEVISDDDKLFNLIKNILLVDKSLLDNVVIEEKRGAMAGTSLSTFLANVYLMELDKYFFNKGIIYARYSDDIIIFCNSLEEIETHKQYIYSVMTQKGLSINPEKENIFLPKTAWNFLGFEYNNKIVDLSKITLKKMKDKIRRKARSIYRWKLRKQTTPEHAAKVLIRVFNNKFYRVDHIKNLSWCKWFFPVITTHKSLKVIDEYLVMYIRYLYSGKFTKKNFNVTYNKLKELGYKSLVHEYYLQKENLAN